MDTNGARRGRIASNGLVRYVMLLAGVAAPFLAVFLVVAAFAPGLVGASAPWLTQPSLGAAATGFGLLVVDVVLPVPSSAVMIALGALFGVVVGGVLSLAGSVTAAAAAYLLGRWAGSRVLDRACTPAGRARVDGLVRRWGPLVVVVSRPVPVLAETVMLAAGASSLGGFRAVLAATAGAVPGSVVYAVAGAYGLRGDGGLLVFGAVILVAGVLWVAGVLVARELSPTVSDPGRATEPVE